MHFATSSEAADPVTLPAFGRPNARICRWCHSVKARARYRVLGGHCGLVTGLEADDAALVCIGGCDGPVGAPPLTELR